MPNEQIDLVKITTCLHRNRVNYVVVGGMAVFLQGGETPTFDVDLTFPSDEKNFERLATALQELKARPKRWKTENYKLKKTDFASPWLKLESEAGDIDLLIKTPGITYEDIDSDHAEFDIGGISLRVASR